MYIAFEGIDGCGKTIQLQLLEQYLKSYNQSVLTTKEIGSCHNSLCLSLRELILNNKNDCIDTASQMLLAAGSVQHAQKVLLPNLAKFDFILSDRSVESNLAYGYASGYSEQFLSTIFLHDERVFPDLVFWFDIDPQLAWNRIKNRELEKFQENGKDRIEEKGLEYQYLVRKQFHKRSLEQENYITIACDENTSIEEIQELIKWTIKQNINVKTVE